jgi:hypothetical protein
VWCNHCLLDGEEKVDYESDEAQDAFFWTGGIPYKLDLVWEQPRKGLIEKTVVYRKERVREMMISHAKFCDELCEVRKKHLNDCISRMALQLSPELFIRMDRQLFDIIKDENGHKLITALNAVAHRALLGYHSKECLTCLCLVAERALETDDYSNNNKRIIEMYIKTILKVTKEFSFQSKKIMNTKIIKVNPNIETITITDIVHFSGNKLPIPNSFNRKASTLFTRNSGNYPGFDFYIWNSFEKVLMAFQVTVMQPFTSHPKIDGVCENCKSWLNFCFGELVQKPIEIYWIIPEISIGKTNNFKDRPYCAF